MAKEPEESNEQEREKNSGEIPTSDTGRSRYSRMATDTSISSWLESKTKDKSKSIRKGLSRGKRLVARKGLNKVSKKQKKKNQEYKKAREEFYKDETNQKCFLCGCSDNLSIHHTKKRGNSISDATSFVTLCLVGDYMDKLYPNANHSHTGGCHGFIHGNASIGRKLKLL